MTKIIFEACVDNIESAVLAQTAGADRIELCSALLEGGLTPSYGLIKQAKEKLSIPIHVLIRPRRGDFLYSASELELMKEDIAICQKLGLDGVVFGVLTQAASVDFAANQDLLRHSKAMTTTFHRAFDMLEQPFSELEKIIELGFDKVLTSGQASSAEQGSENLKKLLAQAANRISIIAAGGINADNVVKIVNQTGVAELHASARAKSKSKMLHQNPKATISTSYFPDEYEHFTLDAKKLWDIKNSLGVFYA